MTYLFDDKKPCPLSQHNIPVEQMGRFCQACIGRDEMPKALESMKVMRAQIILGLLAMFPKDPDQAKAEYQRLMKYVEEW